MNKHLLRLLVLASVFVTAGWGTVIVSFGSDTVNEWNNQTGNNVFITPHPVWATLPPYQWVSYANTGTGPGATSPSNTSIPGTPTAIFRESLPGMTAAVWVTVEVAPIVKTIFFAGNKFGTGGSDFLGAAGAAPAIPALESALESHLCVALSSAQVPSL
jgi:hypothetical protein